MTTASATKRLQKEVAEINLDPPVGCTACPKGSNLFEWAATLRGPEGTPYSGGKFYLDIIFGEEYPYKAPKIKFRTRIYHPNINRKGDICLDTLKDNWSAALTVGQVLLSILALLTEPNPYDPLDQDVAQVFLNNREQYDKTAKEWTQRYASTEDEDSD